ncbi:MAG: hypothetical protein ABI868_03430 [Acidobacteriota bacterium]
MSEQLNRVELLRLARLGATSRIAELRQEIVSLEALIGGDALQTAKAVVKTAKSRGPRRKTARMTPASQAAPAEVATASDDGKAAWSPAARRAVSLRMKKYWAARRQEKK